MTPPRFDAIAARVLSRGSSADVAAPSAADRTAAIAAIQSAMLRKKRRRVLGSVLAAAAAVLVAIGVSQLAFRQVAAPRVLAGAAAEAGSVTVVGHPVGAGATVVETGARSRLADGKSLGSGSRVVAHPDGHVVLSVSTGTRLIVEEGGDVAIVESGADQIFALDAGAVRADVAKLVTGRRFVVRTPDAEVEVRGTSFRVAMVPADPTCGGGTVTRVNVYEGIVSVRHQGNEARVPAGGEWPSGCTNVMAVAPPSTPRGAAGSPPAPGVGAAGSSRSAPLAAAPDPSQLKEQNDCIARALTAKRSGAVQEAISAFEGCIAAYPSSPMVENAMVQRMRLLRTVEPSRAASAARQYLARYPHGFARAEAEAMVQQEP